MKDCPFKIGDKLDSIWGPCEVVGIIVHYEYPVKIAYIDNEGYPVIEYVNYKGKKEGMPHPVVWFPETGHPPKLGERPKWRPTKPTWCLVWDEDGEEKHIRLVVDYVERDDFPYRTAFEHGQYSPQWRYAEPCEPEEIPDWWPEEWR